MSGRLLERLPAALRDRRDVLDARHRWADADVLASRPSAVVLATGSPKGPLLWGVGDPGELADVVAGVLGRLDATPRWVTLPRAVPVPAATLAGAGLVHATSWDRWTTDRPPLPQPGEEHVVRLDPVHGRDEILACLAVANPTTSAGPGAMDDLGWWGVRDDRGGLAGVVGVAAQPGAGAPSGHLHGLGVVPAARGRGTGTALTAAATRHALAAGAPWVSLGVYTHNDTARRVYARLGFRVDVENAGYGPPGAHKP